MGVAYLKQTRMKSEAENYSVNCGLFLTLREILVLQIILKFLGPIKYRVVWIFLFKGMAFITVCGHSFLEPTWLERDIGYNTLAFWHRTYNFPVLDS